MEITMSFDLLRPHAAAAQHMMKLSYHLVRTITCEIRHRAATCSMCAIRVPEHECTACQLRGAGHLGDCVLERLKQLIKPRLEPVKPSKVSLEYGFKTVETRLSLKMVPDRMNSIAMHAALRTCPKLSGPD